MRLLRGRRDPPGSVIDSGNISEHENLLDNEYAVPLGLIFDRAGKWAPPPPRFGDGRLGIGFLA